MKKLTCTKRYDDFPFAHRQPNHAGHCSLIHGHNWGFEFEFAATSLDGCGFVVDFGKLKFLKDFLTDRFDHTLVLNNDDPWLQFLMFNLMGVTDHERPGNGCSNLAKIVHLPDCSSEGLAAWVFEVANSLVSDATKGRVRIIRVTVIEDSKNSATYTQE